MKQGDRLIVRAHGNQPVNARYWEDSGRGFLACSVREYEAARIEGRLPNVVGIDKRDGFIPIPQLYEDLESAFDRGDQEALVHLWDGAKCAFGRIPA